VAISGIAISGIWLDLPVAQATELRGRSRASGDAAQAAFLPATRSALWRDGSSIHEPGGCNFFLFLRFIPRNFGEAKHGHGDMNRVSPAGLLVLVWLDVACSVMSEGAPPVLLALPGPLFPRADFSPPTQECAAGVLLCLVSVHCEGTRGGRAEACSLLAPGNAGGRGERFVINGAPLYLGENPQVASASHEVLTAASVWDCSLMLAKYVERHAERFRGKTVLELGAQTIRAVRPYAR
jgi:hypothetical protein